MGTRPRTSQARLPRAGRYSIDNLTAPQLREIARAITKAEMECDSGDDHRGLRPLRAIQGASAAVFRSMKEQGVT